MKNLNTILQADKSNEEVKQKKEIVRKVSKSLLIIFLLFSITMMSSCFPFFYGREGRERRGHQTEHHNEGHQGGHDERRGH